MGPIPGEAGTDYPVYNAVPDTGFDCAAQDNPGIYTDTAAGCQVRSLKLSQAVTSCHKLLRASLSSSFSLSTCAAQAVRPTPSFVPTEPSLTSSTLCVIGGE